jgi:hypothetical protein
MTVEFCRCDSGLQGSTYPVVCPRLGVRSESERGSQRRPSPRPRYPLRRSASPSAGSIENPALLRRLARAKRPRSDVKASGWRSERTATRSLDQPRSPRSGSDTTSAPTARRDRDYSRVLTRRCRRPQAAPRPCTQRGACRDSRRARRPVKGCPDLHERTAAAIEKHEPVRRDESLFRLPLPYGDAGVIDGLDTIAGPVVTTLSLGPRECMSSAPVEHGLPCARIARRGYGLGDNPGFTS